MFGRMMNSFYYGKSGKGDFKKEDLPKNRWQLFWEMLRVRLSALCRLNLMTVVAWLPLIILFGYCVSQLFNVVVITGDYQNYLATGDMGSLSEEQIAALEGVNISTFMLEMVYQTISQFCLLAIPCIAITGPVQAGLAYVTRNWARDEHAFIWSDFKDAVKENWKQGLGVSLITSVAPVILYVGYQFYGQQAQSNIIFIVPQMLIVTLGLVWGLGTTFMYPMMVSYKVGFGTLIKNSLMLAIARLPQTAGVRLVMLVPGIICLLVFYFTGSLLALLVLAGYYIIIGYALARFVFASFTNGVFDRYINSHMEGVQVNRGLASDEDEDEEDEEEPAAQDPGQTPPTVQG